MYMMQISKVSFSTALYRLLGAGVIASYQLLGAGVTATNQLVEANVTTSYRLLGVGMKANFRVKFEEFRILWFRQELRKYKQYYAIDENDRFQMCSYCKTDGMRRARQSSTRR